MHRRIGFCPLSLRGGGPRERAKPLAALLATLLLLALAGSAVTIRAGARPPDAPAQDFQLLTNPGLELYQPPYSQWNGVNCQVASGWQAQSSGGPQPCWMDTRVFANSPFGSGWVEKIEGQTSQLIVSTEPYTATLLQQVGGLTPGAGYGFHAALLTIYQSSAQPRVDGTMIKRVGLDPTGGTDPQAPSVVWSDPNGHDKGPWDIQRRTAALTAGTVATVFIRVDSLYPAGPWPFMNLSFFDSSILARTPDVSAESPELSTELEFEVEWDDVVMPPAAAQFRGVDLQWRDEGEVSWHNWLTQTFAVEAHFLGEWGHTYHFRARAWASYPNGAWLHGPYRAEGDTATTVGASGLVGRVLSHDGLPVGDAVVALSGTAYGTTSGSDGWYHLVAPPLGEPQAATVAHPAWLSPPPALGLSLPPAAALPLTWTLRPPNDAVANGGLEDGLQGWLVDSGGGVMPAIVAEDAHTGQAALSLGGPWPTAYTAAVSQTVVLTASWEPVLSLWYRPISDDDGDWLAVRVQVTPAAPPGSRSVTTGLVLTPTLSVREWQHLWAAVGPPEAYFSGTVTVELALHEDGGAPATVVTVDEVVLGSARGGPHKAYLPLLLRRR